MVTITKDNYNLIFSETEAYLEQIVANNKHIRYCVADITNSDHKKLVIYRFICKNERSNLRYYAYSNYKKYIRRRVEEFFAKYNIEVLDTGDYNITRVN